MAGRRTPDCAHREARTEHTVDEKTLELPLRRGHHDLERSVALEVATATELRMDSCTAELTSRS